MRKYAMFLSFLLVIIFAVGLIALPEVFQRGGGGRTLPPGLYIMTLATLVLFIGVLLSLIYDRFVQGAISLFVAARIIQVFWEFQIGRHSLWYLIFSAAAHLLVGGFAIYYLNRLKKKRASH